MKHVAKPVHVPSRKPSVATPAPPGRPGPATLRPVPIRASRLQRLWWLFIGE